MDRDSKGRFSKKTEEGFKIIFDVPPIKRILIWAVLFGILLPWISVISKFEILNKLLSLFDELMNRTINENGNENGNSKKGGLFS